MQFLSLLLLCLTLIGARAGTLRAEPRAASELSVLEKIDSVLNKELDILLKDEGSSTEVANVDHPIASDHRLLSMNDIKDGLITGGRFFKTLVAGHPKIWFAIKLAVSLTLAFVAPPIVAAAAIAIAIKVGETMVTVADSREHFAKITDAKEQGFITDAMAAACKRGDVVKAVAAVFWNWCSVIIPVPLE